MDMVEAFLFKADEDFYSPLIQIAQDNFQKYPVVAEGDTFLKVDSPVIVGNA
jgi:hypothetical protein